MPVPLLRGRGGERLRGGHATGVSVQEREGRGRGRPSAPDVRLLLLRSEESKRAGNKEGQTPISWTYLISCAEPSGEEKKGERKRHLPILLIYNSLSKGGGKNEALCHGR